MATITLQPEFGYVLLVGVASIFVDLHLGGRVMEARKKYGVKYPSLYATKDDVNDPQDALEFNAVQRGHMNYVETYGNFIFTLVASGLTTPIFSAIAGAIYLAGRVLYAQGYTGTAPEGRYKGAINYIGRIYLLLGTIYTAVHLLGFA